MGGYIIGHLDHGVVQLFLPQLGEEVMIHEFMVVKIENTGKYEDGVCVLTI